MKFKWIPLTLALLLPSIAVYAQHTTASYTQTVDKAAPTVGITSSLDPSTYTAGVTFVATVPTDATGTVQFLDGSTPIGPTETISNGVAQYSTTALPVGANSIVASYSGDANNTAELSSTLDQVVNKSASTTMLASSNANSVYSVPVTLTATVTTPASATGTVTFYAGTQTLGSSPLSGGTASITSNLSAGSYQVTVTYPGDGNFLGSTSGPIAQSVAAAPGTVTLTSTPNPSVYSYQLTLTVALPPTATGSVTFLDGTTTLGTVPLVGSAATFQTSTLTAGTHALTAQYSGDANFQPGTSQPLSQVVEQDGAVSEVYVSPVSGAMVGTDLVFTALVDTASLSPTGTVQFLDGSNVLGRSNVTTANNTNLLPYSLNFSKWTPEANGTAVPALTGNAANGPDGSPNSATLVAFPDTSATGNQGTDFSGVDLTGTGSYADKPVTFSVWLESQAPGTVTLLLSDGSGTNQLAQTCNVSAVWQRCSVTLDMPSSASTGFVAHIRDWGATAESINVWGAQVEQAAAPGVYTLTNGASASGTGGTATFAISTLLVGTHSITTVYSGDGNYKTSTSLVLPVVIGQGASAVALASSVNPSNYGQSVTFTATVTGPGITPTGTVTFYDGSSAIGTGTVNASGTATFSTAALAGGPHSITAQYGGNTQYNSATSSVLTQVVNKIGATLTIVAVPNPSVFGQQVTFTLTIVGTNGVVPTGSLTLTDTGNSLSVLALDPTGKATFTTSNLTAGPHNIEAVYSGDQNYQ
ncbi:MAG: Ig-like domain repeat protein [Acidobacteriaceae bacterium]